MPVLSQPGEIALAEVLVNQPENECQHDRTSLIEAMDNGASFQQGFAECGNLVTSVTVLWPGLTSNWSQQIERATRRLDRSAYRGHPRVVGQFDCGRLPGWKTRG